MPVPSINTNFRRSDGSDVSQSFISKDYLLSIYPDIANQLVSPELWVWGRNSYGQLGNNDLFVRRTPITTTSGGANWKQISSGIFHIAGIKTDGSLWIWGLNSYGQLGVNDTITRSTPVTLFTGGNDWKQVSCGKYHTSAIKIDGSLWGWGYNYFGQLGTNENGNIANKTTPVTTFAGGNNWKQISCGGYFSASIKMDGTLWTWGRSTNGELGGNFTTTRYTPITTFIGGNDWKQISCGYTGIGAIKNDGSLWTWGDGTFGQLGTNDARNRSTPTTTFAGGNNWKQISSSDGNKVGIKTDGTLWIWGYNVSGQLGINDIVIRSTPITTFIGGNNWKQASVGTSMSAAIKTDGTLWTWGRNSDGDLGISGSSTGNRSIPVTTFIGGSNWKQISCGQYFMATIRSTDIL